MEDSKLRRLRRAELLELLIEQSRQNDVLKAKLAQANEQLEIYRAAIGKVETGGRDAAAVADLLSGALQAAARYIEGVRRECRDRPALEAGEAGAGAGSRG